ncbi:MAG: hypothetical protein HYV09_26595 [Deltaproteobacteria bacterium]|nr:hypothetical protein [Deltaproteobacteria bacterium]
MEVQVLSFAPTGKNQGETRADTAADRPDAFQGADTSADTSPLAAAVEGLQAQLGRAVAAGDMVTARALHAAIGGLLVAASDVREAAGVVAIDRARR